jgi:hypothetical protein
MLASHLFVLLRYVFMTSVISVRCVSKPVKPILELLGVAWVRLSHWEFPLGEDPEQECYEDIEYHLREEILVAIEAIPYILATLVLLSCYIEFKRNYPIGARWSSLYISLLMRMVRQPIMHTCTLRSIFMKLPPISNRIAANHTHGMSAKVRNDGSSFMDLFCAAVGLRGYFLQKSAADDRHNRAGCRSFHWAKDLSAKHESFDPQSTDILCIVDVDMYLDMPKLLSNHFQPVLLTTFQPSRVAKSGGEFSFTFSKNSEVRYTVSGGAVYEHHVWNYGTDILVASTRNYGIWYHHVYNVDRRATDDHHELILLTPIRRLVHPLVSLTSIMGGSELKRLDVVENLSGELFTRLSVQTKDGLFRSIGKPDSTIQAWITAEQDDGLASLARVGKNHELTPATVKTVVKDANQSSATILTEYHRCKLGQTSDIVFPVERSVFNYQYDPTEFDPTAKPSLIPFMTPFILGCYAPTRCVSNDVAAVNGRINSVKSKDIEMTPTLLRHMQEFVKFLVPEENVGHPVDHTSVWDKQSKPTQRRILDRAGDISSLVVEDPVQTFQKSEAYAKVNDPRIISTIPGVNKYNYSRYVYSFTDVLRDTKWYAFGITPLQVAQTLASICQRASLVVLTDLSRFDGRVSKVLRILEHMAMVRYFDKQYLKELNELMSSQQNQRAYTAFGVKYDTGNTRLSGSPETADFNSMDNAFMAYSALRESGKAPDEAWETLGIYGGDDGVTPDVNPEAYTKVCASVGQVLEIDLVKHGDSGVSFLSREYGPEVWHGATDSMCDVKRQLSKLHTTVSLPANITPFVKLSQKLYSYYLTDRNTPIIGQIASLFVEVFPESVPKQQMVELNQYCSMVEVDQQYPNKDSAVGWMKERVIRNLPDFDFGKLDAWCEVVRSTRMEKHMLTPPLMASLDTPHEVKVPVVVNGQVIEPPQQLRPQVRVYTSAELEKMAKLPCKQHIEGKCLRAKCRFKH